MEKKEACLVLMFILVIALNIFWLLTYNKPDKSTLTAFISLKDFVWSAVMSVGRIFITISFYIDIYSPQNTTYNFSIGSNYTIDLNASTNRNPMVSSWWYTLFDLKHNTTVRENVIFTPNTTFSAVRWSNKLLIYVNDTSNTIINSNVTFFIYVPNSAPIIEYIAPEIFVCENTYLSYYFNATDIDEDSLTSSISPPYSSTNPFSVAFSSSINLTTKRYEIFSGTLSKTNAGGVNVGNKTYQETVSVRDCDENNCSDSRQTNITVIEINNAPSIENIGVQTIFGRGENRTFYKQVQVTDTEDGNQNSGNLTFNITILNSTGSVVNLFNISANGIMNFTANLSNLGTYTVTVNVSDKGIRNPHQNISLCGQTGSNRTSIRSFSLTVTDENRAPRITSYYPTNLTINASEGERIYFNITMYDPDGTPLDSYLYVDDILVNYTNGALTGGSFTEFYYAFDYDDAGNHTVTIKVTDGILSSSYDYVKWNVSVLNAEPPSVTPAAGGVSGGGGGGGGIAACAEKWVCYVWEICQNIEKSLEAGILSGEDYRVIKDDCPKNKWDKEKCGFQIRNCFDLNNCNTTFNKPSEIQSCLYTEKPSCYDSIKNCHDGDCEFLVDCGGTCKPCPTCSDKIQNQGEEGIDCGGPCPWSCRVERPVEKPYLRYVLIISVSLLVIILLISLIKLIKVFKTSKNIEKGL